MSFRQSLQAVVRLSKNTPRTLQPRVAFCPSTSYRCLSVSARRSASQEEEFATAFAQSPLYNVIKSHPTAIQAIKEIGELMQTKGEYWSLDYAITRANSSGARYRSHPAAEQDDNVQACHGQRLQDSDYQCHAGVEGCRRRRNT